MTGYQSEPTPQPTEHQQRILASVQQQDVIDALNQVLIDRGLALSIRAVAFQEFEATPADSIGPDPSTGAPVSDLPVVPGINYVCEQLSGGAWVCQCTVGHPGPIASFPPTTMSQ